LVYFLIHERQQGEDAEAHAGGRADGAYLDGDGSELLAEKGREGVLLLVVHRLFELVFAVPDVAHAEIVIFLVAGLEADAAVGAVTVGRGDGAELELPEGAHFGESSQHLPRGL